jgi:hypothetical protein
MIYWPDEIHICPGCTQQFDITHACKKYCSDKCGQRYRKGFLGYKPPNKQIDDKEKRKERLKKNIEKIGYKEFRAQQNMYKRKSVKNLLIKKSNDKWISG